METRIGSDRYCPLCLGKIIEYDIYNGNDLVIIDDAIQGLKTGRKQLSARCEKGCSVFVAGPDPEEKFKPCA